MELATTALIGIGAVSGWALAAAATALIAGRMIHERDAHDRPAVLGSSASTTQR
ncbi:hypothetical protein [Amnibacterium endophyticum]|uniref:Uncharacterized protein n=1 Tax=Amnibacterium endophyticum TaxID=2109337 RepID=A0ABW4LAD4_9MICO